MTRKEQLVVWLTDAYAMEVGIVSTLEKHANDALEEPKALALIIKHLEETRKHAETVRACLLTLETGPSVLKSGFAKFTSFFAGMPTSLAPDTVVKNAAAQYATEHFEIASYTAIIDAATALGFPEIASACKKILAEEKAQAALLAAQFRKMSRKYLGGLHDYAPALAVPKTRQRKRAGAKV